MPYIDVKFSRQVDSAKKSLLISRLGKAISILNKPERYLMVGVEDNYSLYFSGKELENGAFISVSIYGHADRSDFNKFTAELSLILGDLFAISPDQMYVRYTETDDWGFNGKNFGF